MHHLNHVSLYIYHAFFGRDGIGRIWMMTILFLFYSEFISIIW